VEVYVVEEDVEARGLSPPTSSAALIPIKKSVVPGLMARFSLIWQCDGALARQSRPIRVRSRERGLPDSTLARQQDVPS